MRQNYDRLYRTNERARAVLDAARHGTMSYAEAMDRLARLKVPGSANGIAHWAKAHPVVAPAPLPPVADPKDDDRSSDGNSNGNGLAASYPSQGYLVFLTDNVSIWTQDVDEAIQLARRLAREQVHE